MTTNGQEVHSADARRRRIRLMQVIFAGAATMATLALFSAARPGDADTAVTMGTRSAQTAPGGTGAGGFIAVDDDTNPSSGDIFTQNAQDQSTA
jgi:hypothetical protein